jgi:hypothetical protein
MKATKTRPRRIQIMKLRYLVHVFAVGVLVAGLCACKEPGVDSEGFSFFKPKETKVTVSSTDPWTDTGVDVKKGQKLIIRADGEIKINEKTSSSPDGVNDPALKPDAGRNPIRKMVWKVYSVTPDAHGALIGKVGTEGEPFLVGKECRVAVDWPGRLFLGVNDTDMENNSGTYLARVVVK